MRRRQFLGVLGGAAAWPLAAPAQEVERARRVGVLINLSAEDPEVQVRLAALHQGLQELGWTVGRNLRIETRFGAGDPARYRRYATELVAFSPDIILAVGATVGPVQQASSTVPIVFVAVTDPVAAGFVANLAHPGGNTTGFALPEFSTAGKWLQLLKEVAPGVTRAAVIRDPSFSSGIGQFGAIQSAAQSVGVELSPVDARHPGEIERAIAAFARGANGGLIVLTGSPAIIHRKLIVNLAIRNRLPAVYPARYFVADGGLISYGVDSVDQYRRVAGYIDRILKGEKPADLPVQAPTKFELVINLKTAKALGLTVPASLLARADEVIE